MNKLYLVMPAYNEQENIKDVVEHWYPIVERIGSESRMVVIDDGSKDATGAVLQELAQEKPQLIPISKQNEGHGATLLFGYEYAIKQGADYIFQTDSDGQTLSEEFWQLWENREKCGLLIGSRAGRQDGISRVFVTKVLRLVLFFIFGIWVKDANTPFRLMRADELATLLPVIPPKYNLSNVIISVLYTKKKKVIYYPITFRPRQGGVNSINLKKIFGIGKQALKDFRQIKRAMKNME